MENPYQSPSSNLGPNDMQSRDGVSPRTLQIMARTKTWVFVVGVLFVVMAVLTVISAFTTAAPVKAAADAYRTGAVFGGVIGALFYLIPGLKLVQYSKRIGQLLVSRRAQDLELALNEHRGFWKFVGIVTLILLCFMVFGILIAIAAAGSRLN